MTIIKPTFDLRATFEQMAADTFGMARGYNTEGDVITQTIDGRSLNDMWSEFQRSLLMWNDDRSRIVSALTFPVSQPIEDVPQVTGDDFEEASEFGEPKGIRGGDYFSLGYDFKWYDLAIRYTWKYLAEATAPQVESLNNMALEADNRLLFSKVLRAIFNNVNRLASIRGQNVNVYPFYNADGTVPPKWKLTTHTGTHNHYLTSGAATIDAGDMDQMEDHLKHHGYGRQAGSTLIMMVAQQELNTIRNFRVATGSGYDFIPGSGQREGLVHPRTVTCAGCKCGPGQNGEA